MAGKFANMSTPMGQQRVPMTPTKNGSAMSDVTKDARDGAGATPQGSTMPVPTQTFDTRDGATGLHPNPVHAHNQVGPLPPSLGNHRARLS